MFPIRLAVAPMFCFCGRFLPLVVLLAGFPSLASAQRAQSIASVGSRPSRSIVTSTTPSATRISTSVKTFPSVSILPTRSAVSAKSTNPDEEHHFAVTASDKRQTLIPLEITNTPFATESRVPIATLLGARLQLNVSMLNVRNGNVMLGPIPASEILHAPAQARSAELYGLGVSIPLGRGSRVQTSNNLLRSMTRIVRGN